MTIHKEFLRSPELPDKRAIFCDKRALLYAPSKLNASNALILAVMNRFWSFPTVH